MTTFRPLADQVLVEPYESALTTEAGIHLPESTQTRIPKGKVVAVGAGIRFGDTVFPLEVAVGDEVLIAMRSGIEVDVDGKKLLFIRERDIIAIVGGQ